MPSEVESCIARYFHLSRQLAKAERRRGNVENCPIYRAICQRMKAADEARKANWLAAQDAIERTWD